jgi:hypothetical protein
MIGNGLTSTVLASNFRLLDSPLQYLIQEAYLHKFVTCEQITVTTLIKYY